MITVFNAKWSSMEEQEKMHALLPVHHMFGDKSSILENGTILQGKEQHDAYADPMLRIKTRKRCTLATVTATHVGSGVSRRSMKQNLDVIMCFTSTPDWHAEGLDVEHFFLMYMPQVPSTMPRIGHYSFQFSSYISSVYEDIVMSLQALKEYRDSKHITQKLHLKMVPLGVGYTIRTRYGDALGPYVIPSYLLALQFACSVMIDASWIQTLEFVDHTHGNLSPQMYKHGIQILAGSSRDVLDFTGLSDQVIPAVIAPCDCFARLGSSSSEKQLPAALANNSNLLELIQTTPVTYKPWVPTS